MEKGKEIKSKAETTQKKRKKKSTGKLVITWLVLLGFFSCLATGFYFFVGNISFLRGTTVNGQNISGKTIGGAVKLLSKCYEDKKLTIVENDTIVYQIKLSELGYNVDEEKLKKLIRQELEAQKDEVFLQFLEDKTIEMEIPFLGKAEKIESQIKEENLKGERIESQNAELVLKDGTYSIQPEVYGTKIKEEELQKLVKQQIEDNMYYEGDIQINLTKDLYYAPEITSDTLEHKMVSYNKYCKSEIIHTFGNQKEVLGWETIQDWLLLDDNTVKLDETKVEEYVDALRRRYNTIYVNRSIVTTNGNTIQLPSNDYGYRIDRAKEIEQLIADITSNTTVEREPIYSHKGFHRDGRDDVLGCYIEIDLTAQHIWLYKDYKLVVESDIVTGDPSYQETQTGAFPIAFKKSPSVLSGETWNTEVKYWMPFHDGQGLHDATWRNKFGGEIYKTNGSHGCVNLPYHVAEKIYNTIEAGYPIFLYKTAD